RIARARSRPGRAPDDVKAALMLLASLRKKAEAGGHRGQLIEIQALEALALAAEGLHAQAVEVLGCALALAEPEGYVRTFIDEGARMAKLLEEVAAEPRRGRPAGPVPTPRYVQWLLRAFGAGSPAEKCAALAEPLTSREVEVLRLIASGLSNEQIAHELVV